MYERPGIAEQLDQLGVAGLVEFGIVCADRVEGVGLMQADKLVAFLGKCGVRVGGATGTASTSRTKLDIQLPCSAQLRTKADRPGRSHRPRYCLDSDMQKRLPPRHP